MRVPKKLRATKQQIDELRDAATSCLVQGDADETFSRFFSLLSGTPRLMTALIAKYAEDSCMEEILEAWSCSASARQCAGGRVCIAGSESER